MDTLPGMERHMELLQQCPLFLDIPKEQYSRALRFLNARARVFARGEYVNDPDSPLRLAGLILEGELECAFDNERCDHIIMNHFHRGEIFGLSMACARVRCCPMCLRAETECQLLLLDYSPLLNGQPLMHAWQTRLAANCIAGLAQQNLSLTLKTRILAQRGVRDRIFFYLRRLPLRDDGTVSVPFTRTALAEFLGVNRSALSRELKRMKDEGILSVDGDSFRLMPESDSHACKREA